MTHGTECAYTYHRCRCPVCRRAHNVRSKLWRDANPLRVHATKIKSKYGISGEDYAALLRKQKRRCAICRESNNLRKQRLAVDHDHITQRVRGLLCGKCNADVGWFERHRTVVLKYLGRVK